MPCQDLPASRDAQVEEIEGDVKRERACPEPGRATPDSGSQAFHGRRPDGVEFIDVATNDHGPYIRGSAPKSTRPAVALGKSPQEVCQFRLGHERRGLPRGMPFPSALSPFGPLRQHARGADLEDVNDAGQDRVVG